MNRDRPFCFLLGSTALMTIVGAFVFVSSVSWAGGTSGHVSSQDSTFRLPIDNQDIITPTLEDGRWRQIAIPLPPHLPVPLSPEPPPPPPPPDGSFPGKRMLHASVYDPVRDRMIIFGGWSGSNYLSDTWSQSLAGPDSNAWTKLVPSSSFPGERRWGHTAIFDDLRNQVIVFGGLSWCGGHSCAALNDVWVLSLGAGSPSWTQVFPTGIGPSPRMLHTAIHDAARDRMIIFGGADAPNIFNDAWSLSLGSSPEWTEMTPSGAAPPGRASHVAVYDPGSERMVIMGGYGGSGAYLDDTWTLSLKETPQWSLVSTSGSAPLARRDHTAVYDGLRNRMLIFGGAKANADGLNDVWELSLGGNPQWVEILPGVPAPSRRWGPRAVYDIVGDRLVTFGGYDVVDWRNDTWVLELSGTPAWNQLPPPGSVVSVGGPPGWTGLRLAQSYPNPARGEVTILFTIPQAGDVSLRIYDLAGRAVETLVEGVRPAGVHVVRWSRQTSKGTPAPPGVYFYELRAMGDQLVRRLVFVP